METEELYKELHQRFNCIDGELIYKVNRGSRARIGGVAGCLHKASGYLVVRVADKLHKAHRLIFLMGHGYLPKYIDHINGARSDNRLENLRAISSSENHRNIFKRANCSSRYKGVYAYKPYNNWKAQGNIEGKTIHIGYYNDPVFAANAVDMFNRKCNDEFATFNFPKENERSAI